MLFFFLQRLQNGWRGRSLSLSQKGTCTQRDALIWFLWRDRLSSDSSGFDLNPFKYFTRRSKLGHSSELTNHKHVMDRLRGWGWGVGGVWQFDHIYWIFCKQSKSLTNFTETEVKTGSKACQVSVNQNWGCCYNKSGFLGFNQLVMQS